jgi:Ni,Fe-hydrogenase maturation factor
MKGRGTQAGVGDNAIRIMKTLVVGLGNPILSDDGVGVRVAYAVRDALASTAREDVADGDDGRV